MPYRDTCAIISIRALRAKFKPQRFRNLRSVRLSHGAAVVTLEIVRAPGPGCVSERVWLRAPCCGRLCSSIAFSPLSPVGSCAVGCVKCVGVRSRNRRLPSGYARAPFVGDVLTSTAS